MTVIGYSPFPLSGAGNKGCSNIILRKLIYHVKRNLQAGNNTETVGGTQIIVKKFLSAVEKK